MTSGQPAPETRVGDRERRATDDRLRAALDDGMISLVEYDERTRDCWAARTRSDLDGLVADLPAPEGAPTDAPTVASSSAPTAAPTIHEDAQRSGAGPWGSAPRRHQEPVRKRFGRLVVPIVAVGVVVFGGVNVLGADDGAAVFGSRTVAVAEGQGEVQVASLFGSTKVVVPDDVLVRTTGLVLFGSTNCDQACQLPPGAGSRREVVVDANGGFGSVTVETQSEAARGGIDDDRRDKDDD